MQETSYVAAASLCSESATKRIARCPSKTFFVTGGSKLKKETSRKRERDPSHVMSPYVVSPCPQIPTTISKAIVATAVDIDEGIAKGKVYTAN